MIHGKRLLSLRVERSEAGPMIVLGSLRDSSFHRIGMNVIDLLPNHPAAPQRERLKTFLPNLVTTCVGMKSKLFAYVDNALRRKTLERAYELLNSTIAWITDQVKMVRH